MAHYRFALLPGDGIGAEVIAEAVRVLDAVGGRFDHSFEYAEDVVGGASIDAHRTALREETLEMCRAQDAVLFGAVGGPKWDEDAELQAAGIRPEQAILGLRKGLGLFANIRPVKMVPMLADSTPLKRETVADVDMVVLRELTGGIYFGEPQRRWEEGGERRAVDTLAYSEPEIERIVRLGFETARARRGLLTSVDKANILDSSRLWREIANEVAADYPDVELEHRLVDACAMDLIRHPSHFDVIVTENMFGDILTDEASMLAGSMGMLPSASVGAPGDGSTLGLYEPIHGTAPDIAGQGVANPIAMILSAALMLRYSCNLEQEAAAIESAVQQTLEAGHRPADLAVAGDAPLGTEKLGGIIADAVRSV